MAMLGREAVTAYLSAVLGEPVEVLDLGPIGDRGGAADPKGFGYGVPLQVTCAVGGTVRAFVLARTRPKQGFGHDYPADRAWQAIHGHAAYNGFPRHVRSVDLAVVRASGRVDSAADVQEFFQLVERAEGRLYWHDLDAMLTVPPGHLDVDRAAALGTFLAEAHAVKRDEPTLYQRRIRELVGHGECLMGILDSYPHPYPLLPPEACEALEQSAVAARWRLRDRQHRLSRTHGDFHPWNILFRAGTDFSVLDRSRGEWGEPADDVAALAINYLFFGLRRRDARRDPGAAAPFHFLFCTFLEAYLRASGDREVLEVLPPFLAFRALVIAHPLWYPELPSTMRQALIDFARMMMVDSLFDPRDVRALLGMPAEPRS